MGTREKEGWRAFEKSKLTGLDEPGALSDCQRKSREGAQERKGTGKKKPIGPHLKWRKKAGEGIDRLRLPLSRATD